MSLGNRYKIGRLFIQISKLMVFCVHALESLCLAGTFFLGFGSLLFRSALKLPCLKCNTTQYWVFRRLSVHISFNSEVMIYCCVWSCFIARIIRGHVLTIFRAAFMVLCWHAHGFNSTISLDVWPRDSLSFLSRGADNTSWRFFTDTLLTTWQVVMTVRADPQNKNRKELVGFQTREGKLGCC